MSEPRFRVGAQNDSLRLVFARTEYTTTLCAVNATVAAFHDAHVNGWRRVEQAVTEFLGACDDYRDALTLAAIHTHGDDLLFVEIQIEHIDRNVDAAIGVAMADGTGQEVV